MKHYRECAFIPWQSTKIEHCVSFVPPTNFSERNRAPSTSWCSFVPKTSRQVHFCTTYTYLHRFLFGYQPQPPSIFPHSNRSSFHSCYLPASVCRYSNRKCPVPTTSFLSHKSAGILHSCSSCSSRAKKTDYILMFLHITFPSFSFNPVRRIWT